MNKSKYGQASTTESPENLEHSLVWGQVIDIHTNKQKATENIDDSALMCQEAGQPTLKNPREQRQDEQRKPKSHSEPYENS